MIRELLRSPETPSLSKQLVIFTGPTASGKDTVMNLFLKYHPNFQRIIPYTTRLPHENEANGYDYHFVTKQQFRERQKELCAVLERQLTNGMAYYGTSIEQIRQVLDGQPKIWKLDPETACNLRPSLQNFFEPAEIDFLLEKTAVIYLGVERLTVLKDRLRKRARSDDVPSVFLPRLRQEWECWQKLKKNFDPVICNLNNSQEDEFISKIDQYLTNKPNQIE